jgi:hypothetical protein
LPALNLDVYACAIDSELLHRRIEEERGALFPMVEVCAPVWKAGV